MLAYLYSSGSYCSIASTLRRHAVQASRVIY